MRRNRTYRTASTVLALGVAVGLTGCARSDASTRPEGVGKRPTASPRPTSTCTPGGPEERGAAVLATLPRDWRAGVTQVRFYGPKDGLLGGTDKNTGDVMIFVRSCEVESDAELRHAIAHELGHAWDLSKMTPERRDRYRDARGIHEGNWFGCGGCTDLATPAGDFAETYAQWLLGTTTSMSELAPPATPDQLRRLGAEFFRR